MKLIFAVTCLTLCAAENSSLASSPNFTYNRHLDAANGTNSTVGTVEVAFLGSAEYLEEPDGSPAFSNEMDSGEEDEGPVEEDPHDFEHEIEDDEMDADEDESTGLEEEDSEEEWSSSSSEDLTGLSASGGLRRRELKVDPATLVKIGTTVVKIIESLPPVFRAIRSLFRKNGSGQKKVCVAYQDNQVLRLEHDIFQCKNGKPNSTARRLPACHVSGSCSSKHPHQVNNFSYVSDKKSAWWSQTRRGAHKLNLNSAAEAVADRFGVAKVIVVEDTPKFSGWQYSFPEYNNGGQCFVYFFCGRHESLSQRYTKGFFRTRRRTCTTNFQPFVFNCYDKNNQKIRQVDLV